MAEKITIYHNPRCSKSRQTMDLLTENSANPEIVEYLKTPPDAETLSKLIKLLGISPRDLMRKGEAEYKDNNLADDTLTDQQLIDAMVSHPKLIERPIVVKGNKAVIGRPPERVLEII